MPTARYDTAAIVADIRRKHLEWKYRQDQPREPAGSSEGGRWVGDDAVAPLEGMFATGGDPFETSGPAPAKPKAINAHGYIPKPDDHETLARMMFAESAGIPDDYEAVGWAMVNRVGDREFGADLHEVLTRKNGFQILEVGGGPKGDSKLWNASANPTKLDGLNPHSWREADKVAKGITNGSISDPTGGAPFFFSSPTYDGRWQSAPGDYKRMLRDKLIVPAPYTSRTPRVNKNFFFLKAHR